MKKVQIELNDDVYHYYNEQSLFTGVDVEDLIEQAIETYMKLESEGDL